MNTIKALLCTTLLAALAGCGTSADGYYDANGNWHPDNNYNSDTRGGKTPLPGGRDVLAANPASKIVAPAVQADVTGVTASSYDSPNGATTTTTTTYYNFTQAGFYDRNGQYTPNGPDVPGAMLPGPGLCRIWFPDRGPSFQPPVQTCSGIQGRVPQGAYVIYGG